jgi:hypothetical protein
MKTSLPEWANEAINESCQGKSWQTLINSIQQHLKVKHPSSSVPAIQRKEKMTKRFSEYHELEQAVLVEQELREVWHFISNSILISVSFNCKGIKA